MGWSLKLGYSASDLGKIQQSMQSVGKPSVTGTYLAMMPIVFRDKTPFRSDSGTGETDDLAPLTCGQARTAFDLGWVHDSKVAEIKAIAEADGLEWRAEI